MDYLKSLLGLQKEEQPSLTFDQTNKPSTVKRELESNTIRCKETQNFTNLNNSSTRLEPTTASERLELIGNDIREVVKRVIPLEEDDCLSCKAIGTTVLWGSSLFILRAGRKFQEKQPVAGFRRISARLSYSSFAFALFLLGTARLFDLSVFQKGPEKNIFKLAQEDIQTLVDFFNDKSGKEK